MTISEVLSDSKMTEEASFESIERRIANLERNVNGDSTHVPENQVTETLMNVQSRLQSAVTGREKITTLFSKLDDLEKYLNPAFREHLTLSEAAKLNMILLEEERIRCAIEVLQSIKDLIQYLDSEHIKATPELCSNLYEVGQMQLKLQETASILTEETKRIIANYDSLVMSLSKQFILWDSMLTEIEKEKIQEKTAV